MPLFHRALYEIIVALISLSTFPLFVAVVAPLASIARLLSFAIREYRTNFFKSSDDIAKAKLSSNNNTNTKLASKISQQQQQKNQDQPGPTDCVVIVNAASSLEAEGLVRFYISRGCTVVACDRNASLLNDLFKNVSVDDNNIALFDNDQETAKRILLKTVALLGPETVNRVRDLVASCCSSNYSSGMNNNRDNIGIDNNNSSSSIPNPFGPLSLYAIVFVEPSGEIVMRRMLEREYFLGNHNFLNPKHKTTSTTSSLSMSELVYNLCEYLTRKSGGDLLGANDASLPSPVANIPTSHHRRSSSIDSSSSPSLASPSATATSSATGFSQTITRSLSDKYLDTMLFTPIQTQLALLRELTPIALRSQNFHHHHHHPQQPATTSTSSSSTVGNQTTGQKRRNSVTTSSKPSLNKQDNSATNNTNTTESQQQQSPSFSKHFSAVNQQPRVCVISRPDEDEELASAVMGLLYYSSSTSAAVVSSTGTIQSLLHSLAGHGAMRRSMTQSLLDACRCARENVTETTLSSKKNGSFLRTCHIELFATASQRASQKRWQQRLMQFYHQPNSAAAAATQQNSSKTNSSIIIKTQWRVPRVPFFCGSESDEQHILHSSSLSPSRNREIFSYSSLEDYSNCTYQISVLGDIINTPKPKSTKYMAPVLSIYEPFDDELLLLTSSASQQTVSTSPDQQNSSSSAAQHQSVSPATQQQQHQFVHLSFWTRVLSWSLREERVVDVMTAAFHSSPRVENGIQKVFEYICS